MTRHKLLAANIKLQIGLSAGQCPSDRRLRQSLRFDGEGERGGGSDSRHIYGIAVRPQMNGVCVVCADGRGRRRRAGGRRRIGIGIGSDRQAGRRRTDTTEAIAECDCAFLERGEVKSAREDCDCSAWMGWVGCCVVGRPVASGHAFFLVTPHKLSFTVPSWRLQSGLLFCNL